MRYTLYVLRVGRRYRCFVEGRGQHLITLPTAKAVWELAALTDTDPVWLGLRAEESRYSVVGNTLEEQAAYWESQRAWRHPDSETAS